MSESRMVEHPGFAEFYEAEHGRVVTSLLLATGQADTARDAADEAFLRALMAWPRVQQMDSPAGWTFRVALNVVRRRERRRSMERKILARKPPPPDVPAPAGEAWALVAELPERQRTAVVLRFVADLTENEIARAMGISRSTVSSTLADARRKLAGSLQERPDPTGGRHATG